MRRLLAHLRSRLHVLIHPQAPPAQPPRTPEQPDRAAAPPPSIGEPPGSAPEPPSPADVPDEATWQAEDGSCPAPHLVSAVALIVRRAVARLRPPVQDRPLSDKERKRLGGLLFQGAFQFVTRVSNLLRERPDLSPDPARITAAKLSGRNHRAYGWSVLHALFTDLAELANDCFLHEQGSAIEEANLVLKAHALRLDDALLRGRPGPELVKDTALFNEVQVLLSRWARRQHQTHLRHARTLKNAKQELARQRPQGAAPTPAPAPALGRARKRQQPTSLARALSLTDWGRAAARAR